MGWTPLENVESIGLPSPDKKFCITHLLVRQHMDRRSHNLLASSNVCKNLHLQAQPKSRCMRHLVYTNVFSIVSEVISLLKHSRGRECDMSLLAGCYCLQKFLKVID